VIFLFVLFARHNTPLIMKQLGDIGSAFVRFDIQKFLTEIDPNLKWLADMDKLGCRYLTLHPLYVSTS
jgi:hypothetical protein